MKLIDYDKLMNHAFLKGNFAPQTEILYRAGCETIKEWIEMQPEAVRIEAHSFMAYADTDVYDENPMDCLKAARKKFAKQIAERIADNITIDVSTDYVTGKAIFKGKLHTAEMLGGKE